MTASGPAVAATRSAATIAMPHDPPTSRPSSRASRLVIAKESLSDTAMISSHTVWS
ncbi:unannotated protein [freshwater metagenome]|uniref:Unannotated protein n=1 Tax=freshwater metagenome TaxID=449393 RepID=A0A6J6U168_9ZZZZ